MPFDLLFRAILQSAWESFKEKLPFIYVAIAFFLVGAFTGNVWFHLQMGNL